MNEKYYFIGICGIGMSALAKILISENKTVYGSDRYFDNNENLGIKSQLIQKGIMIVKQNIDILKKIKFDYIVVSTAINPEADYLIEAKNQNIPVIHRSVLLNSIIKEYKTSIAICGTSGKSSITSITGHIFKYAGKKPTIINGAYMKNFSQPLNNAIHGDKNFVIFESDESDGSFLHYKPDTALISNISIDHKPLEELQKLFIDFSNLVNNNLLLNEDCFETKKINFQHKNIIRISASDKSITNLKLNMLSITFNYKGIKCKFNFPGLYNYYNVLFSIKIAELYKIKKDEIVKALNSYKGIVRRFDIKLKNKNYIVLDDYAHNPDKISNLISTLQKIKKYRYFIFQPHGYGPTALMFDEYIKSFSLMNENDHLLLLPVYYAGGKVKIIKNSLDIFSTLKQNKINNVYYFKTRKNLITKLLKILNKNSLIAVFGARDNSLNDFAKYISERIGELTD